MSVCMTPQWSTEDKILLISSLKPRIHEIEVTFLGDKEKENVVSELAWKEVESIFQQKGNLYTSEYLKEQWENMKKEASERVVLYERSILSRSDTLPPEPFETDYSVKALVPHLFSLNFAKTRQKRVMDEDQVSSTSLEEEFKKVYTRDFAQSPKINGSLYGYKEKERSRRRQSSLNLDVIVADKETMVLERTMVLIELNIAHQKELFKLKKQSEELKVLYWKQKLNKLDCDKN